MDNNEAVIMSPKRGLNGNQLKLIAIITMFIDHTAAVLLEEGCWAELYSRLSASHGPDEAYRIIYLIDGGMRTIGRLAFPIFLFLLVEGYKHTSDVTRYIVRIFIFGLIAEIPFDLAVGNAFIYTEYQNVFFTLGFTLLMIALCNKVCNALYNDQKWLKIILCALIYFVIASVALMSLADYGAVGVTLGGIIYLTRNKPRVQPWAFLGALALMALATSFLPLPQFFMAFFDIGSVIELAATFAFFFIAKYNGERGTFRLKYFFYLFYPAHLFILFLIRFLWFGDAPIFLR